MSRSLKIGYSLNLDTHITEESSFTSQKDLPWKNFFIEENPNYNKIDSLDLSEKLYELKERYNDLYKFKKVCQLSTTIRCLKPFIIYANENNSECRDVVLDSSHFFEWENKDNEIPYFMSLTIINKDFGFTYKRNHISSEGYCFLFFNNEKTIYDLFFKKDAQKYDPGVYELAIERNQYTLNKINLKYIDKPILSEKLWEHLNKDITCFFNNADFYKNNPVQAMPYKRGIIIYGPPGNGKTTFVKYLLSKYPNTHCLFVDTGMHFSTELFDYIKKVFPEESRKIIVFEDVESINQGERTYSKRSSFLNFIDGAKTSENTMFLATTNYIDLVDEALADRPSRFDKRYHIGLPGKKSRKEFLEKFFPELKHPENKEKLEKLIDKTNNFSGAYFKELFIMVGIQKTTLEEAVDSLSKQIKNFKDKKFDPKQSKGIGLSSGIYPWDYDDDHY